MSDTKSPISNELAEMLKLGHSLPHDTAPASLQSAVFAAEEDEVPTECLDKVPEAPCGYILVHMKDNRGFELSKPVVSCGCGSDCDIIVSQNPSDHSVSRKHCFIMLKYGKVYVRDVSLNGTFTGQPGAGRKALTRLVPGVETEIKPGQVLALADELFMLIYR